MTIGPTQLRVEHFGSSVIGLGVACPRLSWRLPEGATGQSAYEIQADGDCSKCIDGERSVLVPWPFEPLRSRQAVTWRVRVWTDDGDSEWSALARFEVGLLTRTDWSARWVAPREDSLPSAGDRPPHLLRHEFVVPAVTGPARLYATAHGIYEMFLNGNRVGDLDLTPGFTGYDHTLHVQAYDVADLVIAGNNVWQVVLSDGWFRGRHGNSQGSDNYGTTLAFLGQLEVGDLTVATGTGWSSTTGPIRSADLMAGQVEDRRVEVEDWHPMTVADHDLTRLAASPAPPVRRVQELRPIAVTRIDADRQVVDLGQNINGWLRLSDLGPAGTELVLQHGEALDDRGDVTIDHLSGDGHDVGQRDRVTSAGRVGDVFEPRHTVHGFQ